MTMLDIEKSEQEDEAKPIPCELDRHERDQAQRKARNIPGIGPFNGGPYSG